MVDATTRLLRRLIDDPGHVQALRALDSRRFGTLVRNVGLEDAGELLAMATSQQMLAVLDEVLWHSDRRSSDETLDGQRFAVWLEVLLEGGPSVCAQRLAELPEELLIAGFSSQLFVFPVDAWGEGMAAAAPEIAELAERVLDAALHLEFGSYTLVARYGLGWDATISALLAVDQCDHELVQRVLERCCCATQQELAINEDGLHTVLTAQETMDADAFANRDDRRARQGYVSRSSAAAFLALADQTALDDEAALAEDPVTRAYLRELARDAEPGAPDATEHQPTAAWNALVASLDPSEAPAPSWVIAEKDPEPTGVEALREALAELREYDNKHHVDQLTRLTYLANLLMAAGHRDGSPYHPFEAGKAVLEHCARGLAHLQGQRATGRFSRRGTGPLLQHVGIDALFRLGWRLAPERSGN